MQGQTRLLGEQVVNLKPDFYCKIIILLEVCLKISTIRELDKTS